MDKAFHSNAGEPTVTTHAIWRIKRGPKVCWRTAQTFQGLFEGNTQEACYSPDQLLLGTEKTLAADRKGWRDICTAGIVFMPATQDKTEEDERRRQRHELAARN